MSKSCNEVLKTVIYGLRPLTGPRTPGTKQLLTSEMQLLDYFRKKAALWWHTFDPFDKSHRAISSPVRITLGSESPDATLCKS